ncbi:MAG: hypothetical protein Q9195_008908 [Heterodermia aff. obscurata]
MATDGTMGQDPAREDRPSTSGGTALADSMEALLETNSRLERDLTSLKLSCDNAELEKTRLEGELSACKDEIFSLLPPGQVPESEIRSKWNELTARVDQWVDDDSGQLADLGTLQSKRASLGRGGLGTLAIDILVRLERYDPTVSHHDCIPGTVLRHLIHQIIYNKILSEEVDLLGLSQGENAYVKTLEKALTSLEPRRDSSRVSLWRSETLKAMCACTNFSRLQQETARAIVKEAAPGLELILRNTSKKALSKLRSEVIIPAIVLATTIRCSTTHYYFDFTKFSAIQRENLHTIQLRDVKSGKRTPSSHIYISDATGIIGQALLTIQPTLYRRRPGREDVVLSPAVVLAKLTEPSVPQEGGV